MFKNPFQIAITFALVALVLKLSIFSLGIQHGVVGRYVFYIYIFLLLTTVFLGIRSNKINSPQKLKFTLDFQITLANIGKEVASQDTISMHP